MKLHIIKFPKYRLPDFDIQLSSLKNHSSHQSDQMRKEITETLKKTIFFNKKEKNNLKIVII